MKQNKQIKFKRNKMNQIWVIQLILPIQKVSLDLMF